MCLSGLTVSIYFSTGPLHFLLEKPCLGLANFVHEQCLKLNSWIITSTVKHHILLRFTLVPWELTLLSIKHYAPIGTQTTNVPFFLRVQSTERCILAIIYRALKSSSSSSPSFFPLIFLSYGVEGWTWGRIFSKLTAKEGSRTSQQPCLMLGLLGPSQILYTVLKPWEEISIIMMIAIIMIPILLKANLFVFC